MTGDAVALAESFLTDPRVGIPALSLAVAGALWGLLGSPAVPRRRGAEAPAMRPDHDPVSRTYLDLDEGNFSGLLAEGHDRLDLALKERTGHHLEEIPWRRRAAARLGIPEAPALRLLRDRLVSYRAWAFRLETDSWLRWDFWRTREQSRRRFLAELPLLLGRVDRQLTRLENRE